MEAGHEERQQRLTELVDYPRENLSIELKNWLDLQDGDDRAHVARELLALANHGGGFLVFGFDEEDGGYVVAPPPDDLAAYSQDTLNSIVARYAEPRFEVEVELVQRSDGNSVHPVVIVPGDLDTPVRAARDGPERHHVAQHAYYVRRPGPESAPIGTGREWDVVLDRCIRVKREELIVRISDILQGSESLVMQPEVLEDEQLEDFIGLARARFGELVENADDDAPDPYAHGTWYFAYRVIGGRSLSVSELREVLQGVVGHETGWPAWWWPGNEEHAPRPWEGRVECWMAGGMFADSAHSDYWLADPEGMLFLLRGYDDDSADRGAPQEPGTLMDLTLPIWRIGECLLHAERFAAAVTAETELAEVDVEVAWNGLQGRSLTTWASPRRMMSPRPNRAQESVRSRARVPAGSISERLPELVQTLVAPLYESFDFFQPPETMYREELDQLRGRSR